MRESIVSLSDAAEDVALTMWDETFTQEEKQVVIAVVQKLLLAMNERQLYEMVGYVYFLNKTIREKVWKHEQT